MFESRVFVFYSIGMLHERIIHANKNHQGLILVNLIYFPTFEKLRHGVTCWLLATFEGTMDRVSFI